MFRVFSLQYGGAGGRKAATAAASASCKTGGKKSSAGRSGVTKVAGVKSNVGGGDVIYAPARPAYMSEAREKEVLSMAERMQVRDLGGDVPVASFAYDIIMKHPSVRTMGLRERMDFLCTRWARLPEKKRLQYLNDPLRGLL